MHFSIWRISSFGLLLTLLFFIGNKLPNGIWQTYSIVSSCIMYPIIRSYQVVIFPVQKTLHAYFYAQELEKKIDQLQQQCDSLTTTLVDIKGIEWYAKNSQNLREQLRNYTLQSARIASIMLCHYSEQEHYLLVEAGSRAGIQVDMIAVYNNSLVGRVVRVYPWYSKIALITDAACKIPVICGNTQTAGIHEGTNTEITEINYIHENSTIAVGDLVLSSGQGMIFPYGFGVGSVAYVQSNGQHKVVKVVPNVDFKAIKQCILLARSDIITQEERQE